MGWFADNEDYIIQRQYEIDNRDEIPCRNGLECHFAKMGNCWFYHGEGQAERKVLRIPESFTVVKLEKFEDWSQAPEVKNKTYEFGEDYDEEEETEESEDEEDEVDQHIFQEDPMLFQELLDEEDDFYNCPRVESKMKFTDNEGEYTEEEEEDVWFAFVKELQSPTLCKKVLARGWKCNEKSNCLCINLSDEFYTRKEFIAAEHGDGDGDEKCECKLEGMIWYSEGESDEESEDEYSFDDSNEGLDDEEIMAKYSEYTMTNYGCYKPDGTDSPIVLAAKKGDIIRIEKILKESGNSLEVLNSARKWTEVQEKYGYDKTWDWYGDTPLIGAASGGYFRIVKLLLLLGADPTLVSCPSDDEYVCAIDGLNNNVGASEKSLRRMEREIEQILNGTLSSYHSLIKSTIDAKDSAKNLLEQIARQKVTSNMMKAVAPFWKYVNASSAGANACGKRGDNKASDEDAMKAALEDVSTELFYDVSKVEPLAEAITNLRKKYCKPTLSARPVYLHQGSLLQGSQQCQRQGCDKIPAKDCIHTRCARCCTGPCQRHLK